MPRQEPQDINVKFRVRESLWAELQRLAAKNERSVAGEMRIALRRHLRHNEAGSTTDPSLEAVK